MPDSRPNRHHTSTSSGLQRSKSLRLPTSRARAEHHDAKQNASNNNNNNIHHQSTNLTRHGSIRLHRGNSTLSNGNIHHANINGLTASCYGALPVSSTTDLSGSNYVVSNGGSSLKKPSSSTSFSSMLKRPFSRRPPASSSSQQQQPPHSAMVEPIPSLSKPMIRITAPSLGDDGEDDLLPKCDEITYRDHLKKLSEEHIKLQSDYAKLRTRYLDSIHQRSESSQSSASSGVLRDLASIPEDEHSDSSLESGSIPSTPVFGPPTGFEAYRREVDYLQCELLRTQRQYWEQVLRSGNCEKQDSTKLVVDLLNQLESRQKELISAKEDAKKLQEDLKNSVTEVATCRDALHDYQAELAEREHNELVLRQQLSQKSAELAEIKESFAFIQDERTATEEALQEAEEQRQLLELRIRKQQEKNDGLMERCRKLYAKVEQKTVKIRDLKVELEARGANEEAVLTTGAQLHSAHVVLADLANRLRSFLKSGTLFASNHLGVSNEILDEIVGDISPDTSVHESHNTSGIEAPPDVIAEVGSSCDAPEDDHNATYTNGGPPSLVQTVLQAANKRLNGHNGLTNGHKLNGGDEIGENEVNRNGGSSSITGKETLRCFDALVDETTRLLKKLTAVQSVMEQRVQDRLRTADEQIAELKRNLDTMCVKGSEASESLRAKELALQRATAHATQLHERIIAAQEAHRNEIDTFRQQLEECRERNRCLHAVTQEQQRQINDELDSIRKSKPDFFTSEADAICEKLELKKEMSGVREALRVRDEQLRRMAAKFERCQRVWEENAEKAKKDIRELDATLDYIVEILSNHNEVLDNNAKLRQLYQALISDPKSPGRRMRENGCHIINNNNNNNSNAAPSTPIVPHPVVATLL